MHSLASYFRRTHVGGGSGDESRKDISNYRERERVGRIMANLTARTSAVLGMEIELVVPGSIIRAAKVLYPANEWCDAVVADLAGG